VTIGPTAQATQTILVGSRVDLREDPTHCPVRDVDATGQGLWESRGWLARWLPRATIGCSLAGTSPATVLGGWMHAVIRHYKGNAQLLDELARRTGEVEQLIRGGGPGSCRIAWSGPPMVASA
jgi:hypothetical protein